MKEYILQRLVIKDKKLAKSLGLSILAEQVLEVNIDAEEVNSIRTAAALLYLNEAFLSKYVKVSSKKIRDYKAYKLRSGVNSKKSQTLSRPFMKSWFRQVLTAYGGTEIPK